MSSSSSSSSSKVLSASARAAAVPIARLSAQAKAAQASTHLQSAVKLHVPVPAVGSNTLVGISPAAGSSFGGAASAAAAPAPSSTPSVDELPDEVSAPFFKGLGVVFVDVDDEDGLDRCDLCAYAKKHAPPPYADAEHALDDRRWGVLHDTMDDASLCREQDEDQHAFHLGCLRAFVLANKAHYREKPACPVCDRSIDDLTKPAGAKPAASGAKGAAAGGAKGKALAEQKNDGGDDDLFGGDEDMQLDEVGQTGGKKRNRSKQMYSVWVHVRQATGLALLASDKSMNPVAYVTAFGKTVQTARGDGDKTYSCVWNEAFSFQKMMDEEEFSKEVIQIRVEDHAKIFRNTLIGFVKFQADVVHAQTNHEFYHLQYPLVNTQGKKALGAVSMQGQLEVSVCVLAEQDIKDDPTLPRHIYDAEVEMWAELQQKAEVVDFDVNGKYLQNNLDHKKAEDLAKKITLWDIIHVRVFKAEDLPKLDSRGWVDAFIELEYKGLMDKSSKLRSPRVDKQASPVWNTEFTLPVAAGAPLVYESFELVVKDHNIIGSDEWVGKCALSIKDIAALPEGSPPMWKNLYQDIDGRAPTYRGRVLIDVRVERGQKEAKLASIPCAPCSSELVPPAGSYKLDFELFEGMHLLEGFSDYQVDVTLGHHMTVGQSGDERERSKGGKSWLTFESDHKTMKGPNKSVVPFLAKKSVTIHNLPYPRRVDLAVPGADAVAEQSLDAKLQALPPEAPLSPTGSVKPRLNPDGTAVGFTGDASTLAFNSVKQNFNKSTTLLDYKSMMPDLIIYVSKKGGESARKNHCVGYIRIPLNGLTRPTENWEHGEDLSVHAPLWDSSESARATPLKPLVELGHLTSGFLLFKATLTPVSGAGASHQVVTTKLPPVERQRYKFVANVYQAKDMASVDSSGLSSPFVTVSIGDKVVQSRPKSLTCNPLWFEALTAEVELPVNLLYAPDIACTAYHSRGTPLIKFNDKSVFMGRADVPAHVASTSTEVCAPAWYPLQFEEHQYGNILLAFRLTPDKSASAVPQVDVVQSGIERLISGWENYAVEVSALDIRGKMATRHKMKKVDPTFEIECWEDVQRYQSSAIKNDKFTVYIRKPSNPVFYSAINLRIYEGKDLTGVTSIPITKILRSGMSWYKLMELIGRDENVTAKRVLRMWRKFVAKKKFVDPRSIRVPKRAVARSIYGASGPGSGASEGGWDESKESDAPPATPLASDGKKVTERTALKAAAGGASSAASYSTTSDIVIDVAEDGSMPLSPDALTSPEAKAASNDSSSIELDTANPPPALDKDGKPLHTVKSMIVRNVDADGNEVFPEKDLRMLQCPQLPNVDAGNPFEMHWRLQCEYEMLPLVNDPFTSSDISVGKDEIHATFLDKLFSRGKQSVGTLRAHFFGYRIGSMPRPGAASAAQDVVARTNPLFDGEKYFSPSEYCVRVYILRGLQLAAGKGKASGCDPFVSVSLAGGETQKTPVLDGTLNPNYYQCFDFARVPFPAVDSALTIGVYNDNTILSAELIGQTEIALENRLFSKIWNAGQKPIERRALKKTKSGRLPQGFIEVVVQILPMHEAGNRSLDYLLSPPRRMPWQLRVTLWNAKNVTLKNIHKSDGDCCLYDLCAPPNSSDIKLIAGMSGSKQPPQSTDTHLRSIDGTGNFNWRTIFDVELPSPQMLCNLKVQIWNVNFCPDDCLAEAVIPLWGFFELARRNAEKAEKSHPDDRALRVAHIDRQWVHLTHPAEGNTDQGDVEIEVELLPADCASLGEFKAAAGEKGWEPADNSLTRTLLPPDRPNDSFPWYRIDLQIWWRCKYCFRKIRWYLLALFIIFLAGVVGIAYLKIKKIL